MKKDDYKKLVKKISPKENKIKNLLVAFFTGGSLALVGEGIVCFLMTSFGTSRVEAGIWLALIVILVSTLFTALGFFDTWVTKCKCGLIIPTTGFAHSVASAALDYRNDGLITGLGSNFFKLAGSVILYGVISAFFLVIVKVIMCG